MKINKKGKVAIGATLAAGAGYVAGILTAPKSGKDTRKDIAKTASKAKTEGEKQLKKLHSELNDLLAKAKDKKGQAVDKAKAAKEKTRLLLSALHDGDADDPNLKAVIKEVAQAKADLVAFLKK